MVRNNRQEMGTPRAGNTFCGVDHKFLGMPQIGRGGAISWLQQSIIVGRLDSENHGTAALVIGSINSIILVQQYNTQQVVRKTVVVLVVQFVHDAIYIKDTSWSKKHQVKGEERQAII